MEEAKAAAYYDELTRKGEGAARFKQGLGFSSATSNDGAPPSRGSALSSSSFLSSFVRASSPSKTAEFEKQAQLEAIQNKLKKRKPKDEENQSSSSFRTAKDRDADRHSRRQSPSRDKDSRSSRRDRSRSRDRVKDRHSSRRSRSRSRSRSRDRNSRRRSRSRSRSRDRYRSRHRHRSRSGSRDRDRDSREKERERDIEKRSRRWSRSVERRLEKRGKVGKEINGGVDYADAIEGYDKMTPAERVKAKMKFQLSETASKDETKCTAGWERFDFDKDAPLDDEEIEAAEDDKVLAKHISQSFRFSAVEARREEEIKAAHDEAMFGTASQPPATETDSETEVENSIRGADETTVTNLLSDQLFTVQQGSWRDRARKV